MFKAAQRFIEILVLAVATTAPLYAQSVEQTPANAQKFLGTVARQYAVSAYPGLDYGSTSVNAIYRVQDFTSVESCFSRIEGGIDSFGGQDATGTFYSGAGVTFGTGGHKDLPRLEQAMQTYSLKGLPYNLDWSKVASITQSNRYKKEHVQGAGVFPSKMVVQLVMSDTNFAFTFPTEELAARVTYAMSFLKEHCDKTTETGF